MNVRVFFVLMAGAVASAVAAGCAPSQAAAPAAPPPPTVSVIALAPETVPVSTQWIATLDGSVNAQIRPQVSGYLIKASYREGGRVRMGDTLFEIDARPFQVVLAQAEAQLAQARAQLGRAERDVERDTPLARERAIAQSQMDNDIQARLAAEATVKAAEAAVETAQLNVSFTKVRSLVDGVAAIATAQLGDLVGPATLLTTVSQVEPIRAYFSLSEREYLQIARQINARVRAKSLWETGSALTLTLSDNTVYPHPGTFLAADRHIDKATGTIRISAAFPNPDQTLRPGQYGRVSAETRIARNAILVPQRAVTDMQGTAQVRVVTADNRVQVRPITLGSRIGSRYIVEQGLQAGDQLMVDSGPVAEGTQVVTRPFVTTGAAAASKDN